jgi:putative membrane protein
MSLPLILLGSLPLLHVGGNVPTGPYWTHWYVEPSVAIGVLALAAAYVVAVGPLRHRWSGADEHPATRGQMAAFLGGCAVLLIALGPPLDDWSDYFLLSAHMLQHLLLTLVVAPLWLIGTPAWLLEPLTRRPVLNRIGYLATRAVVAFLVPSFVFSIWHIPSFYDAALRSESIHVVEHLMFLGTALLAWWPIVGPLPAWPRLSAPLQCVYLFALTLPGSLVGALITFSAPGLYAPYVTAPRIFGLSLATDQQLAGLLMWVVTGTVYLAQITIIFLRWAAREDSRETLPAAGERPTAVGP